MFGRIAPRYDLTNAVMTLGLDRVWRRRAALAAALPEGGVALDIGTGTGDLTLELARSAPGALVIGLDFAGPMLTRAPGKARQEGLEGLTAWTLGDGHRLPFRDHTFDAVTSAFVLRNFADLDGAFREMSRVVRPGGRVVALEISPAGAPVWSAVFDAYFRRVVPRLGALLTGDGEAYQYLPDSVAAFLTPDSVADRMQAGGLTPLTPVSLLLGSVFIHIGVLAR
jgi:demethylmenaquinone methyltransferase/2-methoxy-6-polyprenyl-1,4-benzoquinol methylase